MSGPFVLGALPFSDSVEPPATSSSSVLAFARLLDEGIHLASESLENWRSILDDAPCMAFSYASSDGSSLLGATIPSETRRRRAFGFAALELRSDDFLRATGATIPSADTEFFGRCAEFVRTSRKHTSWEAVKRSVAVSLPPLIEDAHRHVARSFLELCAQPGTATRLFESAGGAAASRLLSSVASAVLRATATGTEAGAVRLPLFTGASRNRGANVLIWLAVVRAITKGTAAYSPTAFWTMNASAAPWVQVHLGATEARTFASLWSDQPDARHVIDLRARATWTGPSFERIDSTLARRDASLGDLLDALLSCAA